MQLVVKSRFKIFGLGLIISMIVLLTILAFLLLGVTIADNTNYRVIYIMLITIGWFFVVTLLGKQCRVIKVYTDRIVFINLVFPFFRKTKFFGEYDYSITVEETSRAGTFDAIWIIENNRLKDRVSSFYYSNYFHLVDAIKVKSEGRNGIGMFRQFLCLFGYRLK